MERRQALVTYPQTTELVQPGDRGVLRNSTSTTLPIDWLSLPRSAWISWGLRLGAPHWPAMAGMASSRGSSCVTSLRLA